MNTTARYPWYVVYVCALISIRARAQPHESIEDLLHTLVPGAAVLQFIWVSLLLMLLDYKIDYQWLDVLQRGDVVLYLLFAWAIGQWCFFRFFVGTALIGTCIRDSGRESLLKRGYSILFGLLLGPVFFVAIGIYLKDHGALG